MQSQITIDASLVEPSVLLESLGNPRHDFTPQPGSTVGVLTLHNVDRETANAALANYSPPAPTSEDINAERDSRIAADFEFQGNRYQSDAESRRRIADAATEAIEAITRQVEGGNLRWSDPTKDFTWRTADNVDIPMDAPTMIDLHKAAREQEARIIARAQALKANPPQDYTDDRHWI
jgi:hypothetical protein